MIMLGFHQAEFMLEFVIKISTHGFCPSWGQKLVSPPESVRARRRDWCYKHIKITSSLCGSGMM